MRNIRQKEASDAWLKSKKQSILYCCPRFGKIRTSVLILKQLKTKNVLIAYPNTPIKDSWGKDLKKWNCSVIPEYTTFLSLKNHKLSDYELVILDEVHALSDNQIEFLRNNIGKTKILGLTGTLSSSTEFQLKNSLNLDVCFRYPLEVAIQEGVVSDYRIKIYTVPLDNTIKIDYSTKKKTIFRTEQQQCDYLSRTIDWMVSINRDPTYLRLQRMRVIQRSVSKLNKTKELLKNNQRTLVFCGLTDIADNLGIPVYHSLAKEEQVFQDFCNGIGEKLAVVKLAQAGVTIKDLDRVLFNYTDSNEETFVQKINRCMNYEYKNKVAQIIIVSSTDNAELKWLQKALSALEQNKITWI